MGWADAMKFRQTYTNTRSQWSGSAIPAPPVSEHVRIFRGPFSLQSLP
jgi:hypothetical protein